METWVSFLKCSQETSLIPEKYVENALKSLTEELTKQEQYRLALKVFAVMPEHQNYTSIRQIYEKGMQFYPELLKYTLLDCWTEHSEDFMNYCAFLLRMGMYEDVIELALNGIEVMRRQ